MNTKTTSAKQQNFSLLKKLVSIFFFLLIFYVLPLSVKPQLLINWRVIFLGTICTILYLTQPRVSFKESKQKNSTDKNTMFLILLVSGIGQIVSLLEWVYFPKSELGISLSLYVIFGVFLLVAGTIFRLYAIYTLGKYFTSTVQIKDQHKIIITGPYKFLRHPSYTGAFSAMLGCAVLLQSIIGFIIFGIAMLYVYYLRIKTEEETLFQNFKEEYTQYCNHTWKMFPLVW